MFTAALFVAKKRKQHKRSSLANGQTPGPLYKVILLSNEKDLLIDTIVYMELKDIMHVGEKPVSKSYILSESIYISSLTDVSNFLSLFLPLCNKSIKIYFKK